MCSPAGFAETLVLGASEGEVHVLFRHTNRANTVSGYGLSLVSGNLLHASVLAFQ